VFQGLRPARPGPLRWVLNNGAAGMPNFTGDGAGLLVRVATRSFRGPERRFGLRAGERDACVEAIAIEFDAAAWAQHFRRDWPPGSDAHASYYERIMRGPAYQLDDAIRVEV
jgi:hypothetical protein